MLNTILLTVTARQGALGTTYQQIFNPSKMDDLKLNAAGTGISFSYGQENGSKVFYESTSYTSLSALNAAINISAPSGMFALVGVFDPSANTNQRAIGSYDLLDVNGNALVIPDNTRVWDGYYEVITTFVSAGADAGTLALGIPTDDVDGIKAAIAISNGANPWDAAAPAAIIQVGTIAAISEKTTAARTAQVAVAGQVLTAGKMYVVLFCVTTPT